MTQRRRIKKRVLVPAKDVPPSTPKNVGGRPGWPLSMSLLLVELRQVHTFPQVARILTVEHNFPVTRNAAIGKYHRLRESGLVDAIKGKARV